MGFAVAGAALHLLGVTGGRGPAVLPPLLLVCAAHLTVRHAPLTTAALARDVDRGAQLARERAAREATSNGWPRPQQRRPTSPASSASSD